MINKRKIKKKNILPIILTVSIFLIIAVYVFNNYSYLDNLNIYFRNIGASIENIFSIKIDNLDNDLFIGIDDELLKENSELKKLLDLDTKQYDLITCTILNRDITWYNTLTINKGKKDGISVNMAVISSSGLIGRIIEVGDHYSVVELITNKNFNKIAVDIKGLEDNHGILDSYNGNSLIIKNINKNSNINIGDKVYTNGLGGIYPAGIYIGEVIDIKNDDLELAKKLKVKVDPMYNNMRYVRIVRR